MSKETPNTPSSPRRYSFNGGGSPALKSKYAANVETEGNLISVNPVLFMTMYQLSMKIKDTRVNLKAELSKYEHRQDLAYLGRLRLEHDMLATEYRRKLEIKKTPT